MAIHRTVYDGFRPAVRETYRYGAWSGLFPFELDFPFLSPIVIPIWVTDYSKAEVTRIVPFIPGMSGPVAAGRMNPSKPSGPISL